MSKIRIVFRRGYYDVVIPYIPGGVDWNTVEECARWCARQNREVFWQGIVK